jgi:hypothetical protein
VAIPLSAYLTKGPENVRYARCRVRQNPTASAGSDPNGKAIGFGSFEDRNSDRSRVVVDDSMEARDAAVDDFRVSEGVRKGTFGQGLVLTESVGGGSRGRFRRALATPGTTPDTLA